MGRVSPVLIQDWDQLTGSLGDTPKLDANGFIVPIGARCPKGKTYVVWVGRAIGLFNNWGLTSAMVSAFPGGIHKSFRRLEDARTAWAEGPSKLPNWVPPAPRPAHATPGLTGEKRDTSAPDDATYEQTVPILSPPPAIPIRLPQEAAEEGAAPRRRRTTRRRSPTPASPASSISRESSVSSALDADSNSRSSTPISGRPRGDTARSPSKSAASNTRAPRHRTRSSGVSVASSTSAASKSTSRAAKGGNCAGTGSARGLEQIVVRPGNTMYVVVRGDRPGVYHDRPTALLNAGWHPGMKIVPFPTRAQAARFFVESYMEGEVGVPVVEIDEDGEDDEDEQLYAYSGSEL